MEEFPSWHKGLETYALEVTYLYMLVEQYLHMLVEQEAYEIANEIISIHAALITIIVVNCPCYHILCHLALLHRGTNGGLFEGEEGWEGLYLEV